ncbi:MAG: carboxypeptidase regulatory-like domain-containing protein, partial [Chloroflexi bacterium]|nr:carboxypeptidase regulatory-like domain-containing protein [Chloroflexota bacterium]
MTRLRFYLYSISITLLLAPVSVLAHNGVVAIAVPVEGITVDGDLSDWPAGMRRYAVLLCEVGNKPTGAEDFQGEFRLGYSRLENALYLALEVRDESTVIDSVSMPTGWKDWNTEDGCEVHMEVGHGEEGLPFFQYVLYGNDAKVIFESMRTLALEHVKVRVQREPGHHRYEWRLDVGGASQGRVRLGPGTVLGFDVAVCDKDADGSFTWANWGRGVAKEQSAERRGDIVLVEEEKQAGTLRGRAQWTDAGQALTHAKIRLQSMASKALWVQTETDREGRFAMELPAGEYLVEVRPGGQTAAQKTVDIRAGSEQAVDLLVSIPSGTAARAGQEKTARVGPGQQQGAWQSFGIPDGLLSFTVKDLLQDRRGNLWIGTEHGGLTRYDGEVFTTFTTADSLA